MFEYLVETISYASVGSEWYGLQDHLDKTGEDRWELVSTIPRDSQLVLVFKRLVKKIGREPC